MAMKTWIGALLIGAGTVGTAQATTLFSDSLQGNLSQWLGSYSGGAKIAPAPGGGNALTFQTPWAGGDLFSQWYSSGTGSFTVSFDYEAVNFSSSNDGAGLFLGAGGASGVPNSGNWILSDTQYNGIAQISDSSAWQHVSYTFGGSSTQLFFEDWSGSPFNGPDNVFVRNLTLTDNSDGTAIGTLTTSAAVPEPGMLALMMAGLGLIGVVGRRARRQSTPE